MTTDEEEKARAEAEARRQRILNKADDRMDAVSGIPTDATVTSTSSKMAAMRRRRFKKKAAASATTEETNKEEPKQEEKPKAEEVVEEVNTPGVEADLTSAGQKKKYMGVAKMRRKMVLEKRQQEETSASNQAAPHLAVSGKKRTVDKIPILMHAIVVFLLFAAGLDVGLQQGMDYGSDAIIVVKTGLAPRETKFFRLIPKVIRDKAGIQVPGIDDEKPIKIEENLKADNAEYEVSSEDEFGDHGTAATKETEKEENIDPLFGLDLDKVTAGSGLLMSLGRFAVSVHRLNLKIFYYFPRSIVFGIYTTFLQFLQLPPLLCIIALTLRQVVGKVILGAKLPDKVDDEKEHKDTISTVKKFVTGFVLKSFPTASSLYNAWVHLRADMYIVVCGLMVGLAWTHSHLGVEIDTAKETATETVTETVGTDEL